MLPPKLSEIKARLETKGYARRTSGEDALLEELKVLDESADVAKVLRLSEARVFKVTAGPAGYCDCCGRAL